MLQVKAGDLEKLGLLFERHHKSLYGFYFRVTRDTTQSEDLVQDVFERVLKYRHTFKGDGKFITWLFHLARNVLADHIKNFKKLGFSQNIDHLDLPQIPIDESNQIELDLQLLEQALNHLSSEKKELLLLSKIRGFRYKDISKLYNCSEGNIKVKVYRALGDLRKIYHQLKTEQVPL